jgi:hypothetical protein
MAEQSLLGTQKFPVRVVGCPGGKAQISWVSGAQRRWNPAFCSSFPSIFPGSREFGPEAGSPMTSSAASFSLASRSPPAELSRRVQGLLEVPGRPVDGPTSSQRLQPQECGDGYGPEDAGGPGYALLRSFPRRAHITLTNPAHHMRRLVWVEGRGASARKPNHRKYRRGGNRPCQRSIDGRPSPAAPHSPLSPASNGGDCSRCAFAAVVDQTRPHGMIQVFVGLR